MVKRLGGKRCKYYYEYKGESKEDEDNNWIGDCMQKRFNENCEKGQGSCKYKIYIENA